MDLLSLIYGLYSALSSFFSMVRRDKTSPENLEKHETRREMAEFVRENPGARLADVCSELDCNRGTATHHVTMMESGELLESFRDGNCRHFFPADEYDELTKRRLAALNQRRTIEIVLAVAREPGMIQRELTARVKIPRRDVREIVDKLVPLRLIEERKQGVTKSYFPTPELREVLRIAGKM